MAHRGPMPSILWVANYNFSLENGRLSRLAPDGRLPYAFPP